MGAATWAVPVGVLAAIAVACLVFVWWWFPRYYQKGVQADMDRVDEDRRQRELAAQHLDGDLELGGEGGAGAPKKPTTFKYNPPAYTSY